jgi:hypothetical protein
MRENTVKIGVANNSGPQVCFIGLHSAYRGGHVQKNANRQQRL